MINGGAMKPKIAGWQTEAIECQRTAMSNTYFHDPLHGSLPGCTRLRDTTALAKPTAGMRITASGANRKSPSKQVDLF